jgi:hypothetical protein
MSTDAATLAPVTARVLAENLVVPLPQGPYIALRSQPSDALERSNRELRALIARYKVREVQTFAFQQQLLDEATERAVQAEAHVAALTDALARFPERVQAAVIETRTAFSSKVDELTESVRSRDGELARLAGFASERASLQSELRSTHNDLVTERTGRVTDALKLQRLAASEREALKAALAQQGADMKTDLIARTASLLDITTKRVIQRNEEVTKELAFVLNQSERIDRHNQARILWSFSPYSTPF